MSKTRIGGHLLLWFGFLAGAFIAVKSTEVQAAPWSTISWPAYNTALLVAIVGVGVLRISKKPAGVAADEEADAIGQLASILVRLRSTVEGWSAISGQISVYNLHGMIDEELADDLGQFAELRQALVVEFGLDHYAKIMTEFALAERTLNRAWSASADGYLDEVNTCLRRASAHLSVAYQRLDEALKAQCPSTT